MKGEVVFYRLFDLGASVDLDEIQGTVDMPFLAGRMLSERATPKYARFAAPLLVYVDQRTLETNLGSMVVSIAVKLYGVGALAVVVRTPFEASVLRDLRPFAGLRIRAADKEESLDVYCGRLVARIIEDLVPFLHDSYEVHVDPEPYTVYCVSVTETPVRVFTTAWRREVTALLANDPRPDAISDEEVDDTWRNWFSYYQDDLVVLDWDAALVIEPSASYEDTLTVFELANLQLLELRTYDAFLDKVVDKAYDDLEDLFVREEVRARFVATERGGEDERPQRDLRNRGGRARGPPAPHPRVPRRPIVHRGSRAHRLPWMTAGLVRSAHDQLI